MNPLGCQELWKPLLVGPSPTQGQGRAGQGRAGQGRAGQGRAGQGRAGGGEVVPSGKSDGSIAGNQIKITRANSKNCIDSWLV